MSGEVDGLRGHKKIGGNVKILLILDERLRLSAGYQLVAVLADWWLRRSRPAVESYVH